MNRRQIFKVAAAVAVVAAIYGISIELSVPGGILGDDLSIATPVRICLAALLFGLGSVVGLAVGGGMLWGLGWLYFLPSVIAHRRGHPQKTPILLINLLLAFTFIGWVVALVWANSALEPAPAGAAVAASASGFCPHCGAARAAGVFCPGCGAKLG